MKIQNAIGDKQPMPPGQKKGRVTVAQNLIRVRELLDSEGNVIDPKTRQIISKNTDKK